MQLRISETLKKLLITYVGIFVLQNVVDQFMGGNIRGWFALIPNSTMHGMIWQLFTYSFLHVDVMHLVLNLMVLAFVGSDIEGVWGRKRFFMYYGFCILVAGIFYMLMQLVMWNPIYLSLPMMGASGGIYGLLLAYGVLFPDREMLFMMIFPMKAKQFVALLAGIEFLQALFSGQGGLSAIAHLSGLLAGLLFLWLQAKGAKLSFNRLGSKSSSKKRSNHLKLVQNKNSNDDEDQRGPKTWH
jgi:membrane associated rhomboid family serine protease